MPEKRGRPKGNATMRALDTAENTKKALELRSMGFEPEEIAAHFDVNLRTIYKWFEAAIKDIYRPEAEAWVQMELMTLGRMQKGLTKAADNGDTWAVDRVLAIMERRAKYLGLEGIQQPDTSKDAKTALQGFLMDVQQAVALTEATDAEVVSVELEEQ